MSASAFVPGLQIRSRITLKKIRELPVIGEILFKEGDTVKANDIVARASLQGDMHILRVPEKMGIEPFEAIKGLKVKEGDYLKEGDLICEHSGIFGLFKSRYHSPAEGLIELITERTGNIGLRMQAQEVEVDAYVSGTVSEVVEGKSITIETRGVWIQGIFGIGGERKGVIKNLDVAPNQVIEESHIPEDASGKVLVGGMQPTLSALQKGSSLGAVGLVCGSIDDATLASYLGYDLGLAITGDEEIQMSLVITEGFGRIPLSARVLDILSKLDGREASMNGATQVRAGAIRPEIIISETAQDISGLDEEKPAGVLEIGTRIRIIRVPYFGLIAHVVELPHEAEKIETGAFTRVLRAKLEDGKIITVPRANVEAI